MRVLIVEREVGLRQSLSVFLEKIKRHEVFAAASIKEGMLIFQEKLFDLVLCGEPLSDGDGLSMLAAMKEANPAIISVLMTVRSDEVLARTALCSGVSGCLVKPFDLEQLEALICENNYRGAHPGSPEP